MTPHIVTTVAAQGDVVFRRIAALPRGVIESPKRGPIVVAHSETGHHHTVSGEARMFERADRDPLLCYLQLSDEYADIVHHRPHDTHATLRLGGGAGAVYEVRRQREWTPEGWQRVED